MALKVILKARLQSETRVRVRVKESEREAVLILFFDLWLLSVHDKKIPKKKEEIRFLCEYCKERRIVIVILIGCCSEIKETIIKISGWRFLQKRSDEIIIRTLMKWRTTSSADIDFNFRAFLFFVFHWADDLATVCVKNKMCSLKRKDASSVRRVQIRHDNDTTRDFNPLLFYSPISTCLIAKWTIDNKFWRRGNAIGRDASITIIVQR